MKVVGQASPLLGAILQSMYASGYAYADDNKGDGSLLLHFLHSGTSREELQLQQRRQ